MVSIFGRRFAQIEPVRPAEIARVGVAAGPRDVQLLLEALQFLKRGQERPGFQPVAVGGIGRQPEDAVAAAISGFEFKHRLDRRGPGARHPARRGATLVDLEVRGRGAWAAGLQFPNDGVGAVDGLNVPAQRQHIAPIAFAVKQRLKLASVGKRAFESCQPAFGCNRNIVGPVQHARFSWRPSFRGLSPR